MNNISHTEFKGFPEHYQFRPHLCREFIRLLTVNSDTDVLVLEARPGIGATSVSAEYLASLTEPGILLTINTGSRAGYSLPFLIDQAIQQAYILLEEKPKQLTLDNVVGEWHRVLTRLQRKARSQRNKLHIIIDGLYQIPADDERYLQDVVRDVLALGNSDVRHILTWREDFALPKFLNKFNVRKVPLPPLSEQESRSYLEASGVDSELIKDIINATDGVPALLSSTVRLHHLGKLEKSKLHSDLAYFYELEWTANKERSNDEADTMEKTFAFLVFSKRTLSVREVARLVEINETTVVNIIENSGFASITEQHDILFSSNTHRDFLKVKLSNLRAQVLNAFVDQLANEVSSKDSVQLLPNYFEELGRDGEIVALLTPDHLDSFLAETQSLTALRRRNEMGFRAAKRTNTEVEAFRFGLQTSIVRCLEGHDGNEARLAALATTGRLDAALDVAQGEPTKEARLLLLSQYVKVLYGRSMSVDAVMADTIGTLIKEIDFSADKERALKIAENLVGPFPELGISIVEQSSEGAKDYQNAAFTHLILKTQTMPDDRAKASAEIYASKVSDSHLQGFLRATEAVFRKKSAEEIKRTTRGLDAHHRSFLLRQWIKANVKETDAVSIADYALDEVARDPTYLPTAADLREICMPVAGADDALAAQQLLNRIEAQRAALLEVTGTVDRFRLDLEIARARTALSMTSHDDALSELYIRASDLLDNGSKLECFSWMRASLNKFINTPTEVENEFAKLCELAIQETTDKCLETTAEHLDVFKGVMLALVEFCPESGLQLVNKINTEQNRDSAHAFFVAKLVSRQSKEPISVHLILKSLGAIVEDEVRWQATVKCLHLIAQRLPPLDGSPKPLLAIASKLTDPLGAALAWRWIIPIAKHYAVPLDLEEATTKFKIATDNIDQIWLIPDLNYWFIESLAKVDREFASQRLDKYESYARERSIISRSYAELLSNLGRLSIISFAGILSRRQDNEEELNSLFAIIEEVPSLIMQNSLYTDLALRAYSKNRRDIFDKVCEQGLVKLIKSASNGIAYLKNRLAAESYVALFLWNAEYADTIIGEISTSQKDECRRNVVMYYVTGNTIYEPYNDELYRGAHLTYPTALNIVSLIEQISVDSILGHSIEMFCSAATSKLSVNEITLHQRVELASRLKVKIERDLPDNNNIKHDGWKVLTQACCLKLMSDTRSDNWKAVIENAKSIPNTSDSVFVLGHIAAHLPNKLASEKAAILKEAELRLNLIPSQIERVRRRIAISSSALSSATEKVIAKRLLTTAMTDSLSLKDIEAASDAQKKIIDAAYQLDEEFAIELTKMIDNDPARIRAKTEANSRLEAQRNMHAVVDKRYSDVSENIEDVGEISWEMLGSLNANKVAPQKQEELANLLKSASQKSLSDVFGFYWWYLKNLQFKYEQHSNRSRTILVPLFEVTRLAALLAERIGKRVCGNSQHRSALSSSNSKTSFVLTPGVRDDALIYIQEWIEPLNDKEVFICDPYFKIDDIDFIKALSFHKDDLSFTILTCAPDDSTSGDLEAEYRAGWSKIAHVEPPPLKAVHVTYDGEKAKHPIHDRWLFCGASALRVGTSIGSLGLSKLSEISEVSEGDVSTLRNALDPFIQLKERWIDGRRLRYRVVQW